MLLIAHQLMKGGVPCSGVLAKRRGEQVWWPKYRDLKGFSARVRWLYNNRGMSVGDEDYSVKWLLNLQWWKHGGRSGGYARG